jgi:hypothetical protein
MIMYCHLSGRMVGCALAVAMLGGCAATRVASPVAAAATPGAQALAADAPRTGGAPLYVRFVKRDGRIVAVETGTAGDSDIMLAFQQHDASGTVVVIKQRAGITTPVKLDLYLSPDGMHFNRVSSCPLTGKPVYRMWTENVAWLAVGGAHLIAPGTTASCG